MNLTEVQGVKVIVDYCHNVPAMVALGGFVDKFFDDLQAWERPQKIGVIATAGDRRDQDMRDLGLSRRASTSTASSSARTSGPGVASAGRPRS